MSENNELEGIIERVKENVVGQDVAIEEVCSLIDIGEKRFKLLDKCDLGPSEEPQFCSALLIGSSGTGKTFMLKNIANELDLLFCIICSLRYCYPPEYYNFNELRSMLTMCWVNYVGWSPFESYFNDIKTLCENNLFGKIPIVNLLDETCCESKKSKCQRECGITSSSHTKGSNFVRVDELLARVSKEFIDRPQSERDEAVKMLAWRMI